MADPAKGSPVIPPPEIHAEEALLEHVTDVAPPSRAEAVPEYVQRVEAAPGATPEAAPEAEAVPESEVQPAPVDAMGPAITVPSVEDSGGCTAHEVTVEELFRAADACALAGLGMLPATGPLRHATLPLATVISSDGTVMMLGGLRVDPGPSSGGTLDAVPPPAAGVEAWLDGLDRVASFLSPLQAMADMLRSAMLPSSQVLGQLICFAYPSANRASSFPADFMGVSLQALSHVFVLAQDAQ